ncbi:uncharacterized protein LOC143600409 [Bidens hawaiensis]|uniref:uncharacterized protein LOC143600409 n=1 Tax=Bidens hawaiensis TaxID=980011 RepID=UPI0040494471
MGKTKERAWRGIDERKRELRYTNERKRKIKRAHKLLDDDVVILDPKRKRRELVEKVSSSSDILIDDDDGGGDDDDDHGDDDDVELLDPKHKQCELIDDDDGGGDDDDDHGDDDDVELLDPKHKQCELIDDDDGGGDDDDDHGDDDDVELLDPKHKQCELIDDDDGGGDDDDDHGDDDDVELLDPKHKQCELIDDDDGGGGDDDDDPGDDDGVKLLDSKQKQCELDDGGGDVELLELKHEQHDLFENVSPMSDSHSFFQSGIVYVRGYKVKQSIATILEAIFKKHGDIAANCVFKAPSTRTHFLEVVCEIVQRIQTNGMTKMVKDNIESKLSDAEAANINVSWIRANFEAFHKRKESGKKHSLLMEMKSNTMLVKAAALIDLRERCEELMDVQERFEKAEKCVRVLHLVEKNINDNILEYKAEIDSLVAHPVV